MPFMNVQRCGNVEWIFHSQEYCRYMTASTMLIYQTWCHLSVESKIPRNQERDVVPCTKVQVSFEDPLWFMHKRHSLQVEGARGGGIPQLQISASKYEVADAPNPPTPQICAHQKHKNWRRTHCSVYCKRTQRIWQSIKRSLFLWPANSRSCM